MIAKYANVLHKWQSLYSTDLILDLYFLFRSSFQIQKMFSAVLMGLVFVSHPYIGLQGTDTICFFPTMQGTDEMLVALCGFFKEKKTIS